MGGRRTRAGAGADARPPAPADDAPGGGATCRRALATDDDLRAAARLLARRLWTVRRADRVAERLGCARWTLLDHEAPAGRPCDPLRERTDGSSCGPPGDRDDGAHLARQSAELARLLAWFAERERVRGPAAGPVRRLLLHEPWRLGEPLRDRGAARARRVLLPCPVVAYGATATATASGSGTGTGTGAWAVFTVPAVTSLPAWRVGRRDLLADLGVVDGGS